MKYKNERHHTIDFVFVLLLFLVFTMSALSVVYIGSHVYSSTVNIMDRNYNENIVIDYISEKVRQNNSYNQIEVKVINGKDILCLHETYKNGNFTTYIYEDGHKLKELFINDKESFDMRRGEAIMDLDDLSLSINYSLLEIQVTVDNRVKRAYLTILGGNDYEA